MNCDCADDSRKRENDTSCNPCRKDASVWADLNVATDKKEDECGERRSESDSDRKHLRAAKPTDNSAQHHSENKSECENDHDV